MNYVKVTYNVTSTTDPTRVISYYLVPSGPEWCSKITWGTLDGPEVTISNYGYTFSATGLQSLYFQTSGSVVGGEFSLTDAIVSVEISSGITEVGSIASNENMTAITFGPDITVIGRLSENHSLVSCTLPDGITEIPEACFMRCFGLVAVNNVHSGITSIGQQAFQDCNSLTSITLPDSITSMGQLVFDNCQSLEDIHIPSGLTSIPDYFISNGYSLTGITIHSGITTIGNGAFDTCSGLTHVDIPDSVETIGLWAFNKCYSLTSATIGSGLTAVSQSSFSNTPLVELHVSSKNNPSAHEMAFKNVQTGGTLYYPSGETATYGENGWLSTDQYYLGYYGWNGVETGDTPTPDPPIPSGQTVDSGSTSHTITYSGCPLVFDHSASTGTWNTLPTVTTGGTTDDWWIAYNVPANDTDSARTITYYYLRYSGQSCSDLIDTVSYTISQAAGSGTPTPSDRYMYLNPSAATGTADSNSGPFITIHSSGCSIDSSYTPTYTISGGDGWFSIQTISFTEYFDDLRWSIACMHTRNLTNQTRDVYVTFNGVYDTDGNVYNGLVYHYTQEWGSYVFANFDSSVTSAETDTTVEIVGVNTNICSVTVSGFTGYPANRWEGFEQPSYTQLGNYITVHIPENPAAARSVRFSAVTIYGENCENTEVLRVIINQTKSGATPTPVQKDIKAADADYSVGSGTGNASTTIQTSGCAYDHFTYLTGGSFSVTATSGPNNTIVFTYPQNPTTSPRTGYVYITFYDSDGNTYGPQTITFTQQAGSSPGPGPGPDPETGYVLTTLTISDQEQHRYFVEARPGVVYSAAGQYYKTIPACEARYSLYYVNSYGGVDVLPFKGGGQKKTDNITRFNYSRSFRNNTPEFENVNYMNEIKAVWELQTGWIGDDGSSRMHELVESTIVYLYDAEEKTYTPVVMTDKKLEYKTYRNQGRKFYNYTVNVEESQSKERR